MFSINVFCLFAIIIVSAINASEQNSGDAKESNESVRRQKRNYPDYGWGYADYSEPNCDETHSNLDEESVQTAEAWIEDRSGGSDTEYRPCDPYNLSPPDFSAPNRRLSQIKCYEYIWQIKYRQDLNQRFIDCTLENLRKMNSYGVIVGRDTIPGEFPHMAAVGWKATVGTWVFKCGGSLISSKFVLTAGHCTRASPLDTSIADTTPKIVRLGDKNIIDKSHRGIKPVDVNILRIIPHPQYRAPKKYYDIALFELEKEVEFSRLVQPACLWTLPDVSKLGTKATVTGWGVVKSGGLKTSPELQAATVDLIDSPQCDNLLGSLCNRLWCRLESHQMCAGTLAGGADTCQGDSGGPLQVLIPLPPAALSKIHYVLGITSFGFKCGLQNTPAIYTRVASFLDWIEDIVWKV